MKQSKRNNSKTIPTTLVGRLIQEYRRDNNLGQSSLAEYLQVKRSAIANFETGNNPLTIRLVPKVSTLLNIPQNELTKMVLVDRGYNI